MVDQVEGHHAECPDGLLGPVKAPTDVLRRVDGQHLAGGLRVPHQEAHGGAHLGPELHVSQPGSEALLRGDHAEERLSRHIDLGLELDARIAHGPPP